MRHAFVGLIGAAAVLCAPTAMAQTWHWADASGEPLIIKGLPAGPHKVLIELVNANHQTLDKGVVTFVIPERAQAPSRRR
jgi:Family of unknown function (DUF6130)